MFTPLTVLSGLFSYSMQAIKSVNRFGGDSHYLGPFNTMPSFYQIERGEGRISPRHSGYHLKVLDDAAYKHDVLYMKSGRYSPRHKNLRRAHYDLQMGVEVLNTNPVVGGLMLAAGGFRYLQERAMVNDPVFSRVFGPPRMPWD